MIKSPCKDCDSKNKPYCFRSCVILAQVQTIQTTRENQGLCSDGNAGVDVSDGGRYTLHPYRM